MKTPQWPTKDESAPRTTTLITKELGEKGTEVDRVAFTGNNSGIRKEIKRLEGKAGPGYEVLEEAVLTDGNES